MTSDVVLTSALRNNLLSLQNTQSLIDKTQFNLATGRKINSALDGPSSFFASQALNNRASDLTRLLDGIGQSIQVIKAADAGVTALTTLVEQADSIAANARDVLANGQQEARIEGDTDLEGIDDLTAAFGTNVVAGDTITFTVLDEDGAAVTLQNAGVVTIAANQSSDQLVTAINDLNQGVSGDDVILAELDESGNLIVKSLNGGTLRMDFDGGGGNAGTDAQDQALASALGFGDSVELESTNVAATNRTAVTAVATATIDSLALMRAGNVAVASTALVDLTGFSGIDNAADQLTITINGQTTSSAIELFQDADGDAQTIQGFVDDINNDSAISPLIEASYDTETGRISIRALSSDVQSVEFNVASNNGNLDLAFGFGAGLTDVAIPTGVTASEAIRFGAAAAELLSLEEDFDNLRAQIDALITDTGYRGTNLLNGDDLETFFNEDRTNSLVTSGVTFSADGMGISAANFRDASTVDAALEEVRLALNEVRAFGSTLANNLSIIQTRETFTKSFINTLTEGADKLTLADQNEEGAKLLALQTRQQLGVTSLSLASQSQQSVLRLF